MIKLPPKKKYTIKDITNHKSNIIQEGQLQEGQLNNIVLSYKNFAKDLIREYNELKNNQRNRTKNLTADFRSKQNIFVNSTDIFGQQIPLDPSFKIKICLLESNNITVPRLLLRTIKEVPLFPDYTIRIIKNFKDKSINCCHFLTAFKFKDKKENISYWGYKITIQKGTNQKKCSIYYLGKKLKQFTLCNFNDPRGTISYSNSERVEEMAPKAFFKIEETIVPPFPLFQITGKEPRRTFYTIFNGYGYCIQEAPIDPKTKEELKEELNKIKIEIYHIPNTPSHCTINDFNQQNHTKHGTFSDLPKNIQEEILTY
jgi:hypothetical protein